MLKKLIYLFTLFLSCSALSMEKNTFYDAVEPEENFQLPEPGNENFIELSQIEIVGKTQNKPKTTQVSASIHDLPAEILLKILILLTNAKTPKEAIQSIINFSGTNKIYNQFVKLYLPDLLKTIIDRNKKFTVKEFLSTNLFPLILIEAFQTYFEQKNYNEKATEIQNLIKNIKIDITNASLSKENKYILANLYFLNLLTDEDKNNLLLAAASNGSTNALDILLELKSNPNAHNGFYFDATECFRLDQNKFYTYFNKPITNSAYDEPNIMGGFIDWGYTPLMRIILNQITSFEQKNKMIKILLKNGADINKQSKLKGHSALMLAVLMNNEKMVKFLLENGANKEIQDYCGHTALEIAQEFGLKTIIDLLSEKKEESHPTSIAGNDGKTWIALWTMLFESISLSQLQTISGLENLINNILENPKIISSANAQNIILNLNEYQQNLIRGILDTHSEDK